MGETKDAKRWFSWPRFMRSRSAGSPFLVMYTWCPPVRVGYGSRASGRLANRIWSEHFFSIRHFARETCVHEYVCVNVSADGVHVPVYMRVCVCVHAPPLALGCF